jgi:cyclophilin family peptidyl-prolyl cis-trans isomerase
MTNRKERIKAKQDEKRAQQIMMTRLITGGIAVLGVAVVLIMIVQSSLPAQPAAGSAILEVSGNVTEICQGAVPAQTPTTRSFASSQQVLEQGTDYRAIMCTDAGAIYLDLLEDQTPVTVNNFVFLAQNGFYNNTIFHRVIANFMAQGGDPTGTGTGGPGYRFQDEFVAGLTFDRPYLLAMANAGPGTNGSQFFITFTPTPHLNNAHTIFGEVISGQENVNAIQLRDPNQANAPATILQTVVIVTDPSLVQ